MSFSMLGSRLAYSDLLSSEAWQCWSTPTAWKRDSALAVVATLLAIFLLWNMQAFGAEQIGKKGRFVPSHLKRYEWAIVAATVLLLLIYTFVILPNSFREGLCARMTSLSQKPGCADLERKIMTDDYHQIMQPYNVYVLHVLGLWCGVVLPVFLFLIRCVSVDWDQWKERRSRLEEYVAKANTSGVEDRAEVFEGLVISLQDYVVGLKTVAERYVPILLGVSLILLYEQMTPSSQTVTDAAVESGKLAVWLLMGPSLLTCIIIVALGYQKAAHNAESGFRALVGASSNAAGEVDLLKRIAEARSKLIWDQSPAAFILSVVKSATVSIPLLLAVVIYVLRLHTEQWFRILVPKALVDFVQNVYK
jgi:hypothetical protein